MKLFFALVAALALSLALSIAPVSAEGDSQKGKPGDVAALRAEVADLKAQVQQVRQQQAQILEIADLKSQVAQIRSSQQNNVASPQNNTSSAKGPNDYLIPIIPAIIATLGAYFIASIVTRNVEAQKQRTEVYKLLYAERIVAAKIIAAKSSIFFRDISMFSQAGFLLEAPKDIKKATKSALVKSFVDFTSTFNEYFWILEDDVVQSMVSIKSHRDENLEFFTEADLEISDETTLVVAGKMALLSSKFDKEIAKMMHTVEFSKMLYPQKKTVWQRVADWARGGDTPAATTSTILNASRPDGGNANSRKR